MKTKNGLTAYDVLKIPGCPFKLPIANSMTQATIDFNRIEDKVLNWYNPNNKILIIGQAPPAVAQEMPYDTTLLYEWLREIGITKDQAARMFEFEAVSTDFPGVNNQGGHKPPSKKSIAAHWPELESKIQLSEKVWLLGRVAKDVFYSMPKTWSCNILILETMHPSRRNLHSYNQNKAFILESLKFFINK